MDHWHLSIGGVEAPRVRASDTPDWRRYRPDDNGRTVLALAPCGSPETGGRWAGLCEKNAPRFGWYPGAGE